MFTLVTEDQRGEGHTQAGALKPHKERRAFLVLPRLSCSQVLAHYLRSLWVAWHGIPAPFVPFPLCPALEGGTLPTTWQDLLPTHLHRDRGSPRFPHCLGWSLSLGFWAGWVRSVGGSWVRRQKRSVALRGTPCRCWSVALFCIAGFPTTKPYLESACLPRVPSYTNAGWLDWVGNMFSGCLWAWPLLPATRCLSTYQGQSLNISFYFLKKITFSAKCIHMTLWPSVLYSEALRKWVAKRQTFL